MVAMRTRGSFRRVAISSPSSFCISPATRWRRENSRGIVQCSDSVCYKSGRIRDHGALYFRTFVDFDLVTGLDVSVILDTNTAFRTGFDALGFVFVSAQRFQLAFVNDDIAAQHTNRLPPHHGALLDQATGDGTEA